ncbi:holothin acyltransferase-like [Glandiceps talaboti]
MAGRLGRCWRRFRPLISTVRQFYTALPMANTPKKGPNVMVRLATYEDMKAVSDLTIIEGWDYSVDLVETMRRLCPDGFYLAEIDDEIVGTAYTINHTDSLAFQSLAITKEEYRNRGIYRSLFFKCMEYNGKRNIGGNAVGEKRSQGLIRQGFTKIDFEIIEMRGMVNRSKLTRLNNCMPTDTKILPMGDISFESLVTYDAKINPFRRAEFLKMWCIGNDTLNFAAMKQDEKGNRSIVGYINTHKLVHGFAVLPLYADDTIIAESLLFTLLSNLPDNVQICMNVPVPNQSALDLVKKYSIDVEMYKLIRQYSKQVIPVPCNKIYSILSPDMMPA